MKPSHAISALLLALVAALAIGCSAAPAKHKTTVPPTQSGPIATPPPAGSPMCTNDAQCGMGPCGRCDNGACVRIEGCCAADTDCQPGSRCRAGRCR